jgi:N-methylhydantoinase A
VTDAHAVIGTLCAANLTGSGISFDPAQARTAIDTYVAQPLGWSVARAAHAIIDIAVANMAEMVRLATVRRGLDPRDFAILAYGGAGPLHAVAVGVEVGAAEVIVPPLPGMFSALGAALGDIRHELVQTVLCVVRNTEPGTLAGHFDALRRRGDDLFAAEPAGHGAPHYARFADIRFQGQLFDLRVPLGNADQPLPSPTEIERAFREQYRSEFGFDLPDAVAQLVNLRLEGTLSLGIDAARLLEDAEEGLRAAAQQTRVVKILERNGDTTRLPVVRAAEALGTTIAGPALIEHAGSTVWIHPGHRAEIGRSGRVLIQLSEGGGP